MTIETLGIKAKQASRQMNKMTATEKNVCLKQAASALMTHSEEILLANAVDIKAAREIGRAHV